MHPQNLRPLRRRDDRRGLRAGLTRLGLRPARDPLDEALAVWWAATFSAEN